MEMVEKENKNILTGTNASDKQMNIKTDCVNKELIRLAKKAADAWRNDSAYYQATEIIDMLIKEIERCTK